MPDYDSSQAGYKFIKERFLSDTSKAARQTITWVADEERGGANNVFGFDHVPVLTEVRGMFRLRGSVLYIPEVGRFSKLSFVIVGGPEGAKPRRLLGLDFQLPGDKFYHSFNQTVIRQSHWHSFHEEYGDGFATNYEKAFNHDVGNWLNLANEALSQWAIAPIGAAQWDIGRVMLAMRIPGTTFAEGL